MYPIRHKASHHLLIRSTSRTDFMSTGLSATWPPASVSEPGSLR